MTKPSTECHGLSFKAIGVVFGLVGRSVCNIMMDLNIFEFIHIYLMVYHVKENIRFFVRYVFQISCPHINVLYPNPPAGALRYRGGPHPRYVFRGRSFFFKTSACPRFCKRRVLFCTQVRSMGVKIPLQSTKYKRL